MLYIAAVVVGAYLLGSIPTSIIVGKLFFKQDIRESGSGNAGGTNSFRVFGPVAGTFVILFDIAKGAVSAVVLPSLVAEHALSLGFEFDALRLVCAFAAVIGHVWPVFAGFKGGKGVATAAGALAGLAPIPFAVVIAVFVIILLTTGVVSLGSIFGSFAYALSITVQHVLGYSDSIIILIAGWVIFPLIVFTHRANISRLLRGEEKAFENLKIFSRNKKKG